VVTSLSRAPSSNDQHCRPVFGELSESLGCRKSSRFFTSSRHLSWLVFLAGISGHSLALLCPNLACSSMSAGSAIEYRLLGGVLDFYFVSGPTPQQVLKQYAGPETLGRPTW
jgi:alpha-glucosidase (family GH31 glycosyl hydrolase)